MLPANFGLRQTAVTKPLVLAEGCSQSPGLPLMFAARCSGLHLQGLTVLRVVSTALQHTQAATSQSCRQAAMVAVLSPVGLHQLARHEAGLKVAI